MKILRSRTIIPINALLWLLFSTTAGAQTPMMPPMGTPWMPGMGMPGQHMPMMPPMGSPGRPFMGMPMAPGMHPGGGMNPLAALNLTPEQIGKWRDMGEQARAASVDLMTQIASETMKLPALLAAATPDPEKVGTIYQKIFDLQRQAIEHSITLYNEQLSVLSPVQLEKWNAFRAQIMGRFLPPGMTPEKK